MTTDLRFRPVAGCDQNTSLTSEMPRLKIIPPPPPPPPSSQC